MSNKFLENHVLSNLTLNIKQILTQQLTYFRPVEQFECEVDICFECCGSRTHNLEEIDPKQEDRLINVDDAWLSDASSMSQNAKVYCYSSRNYNELAN